MIATPLTERDVFVGHQLFVITRVFTSSAAYLVVDRGLRRRRLVAGACSRSRPRVLIGTAFSMPMAALAATRRGRRELRADLPLRDRADVPLLGDVLPGLPAAARFELARLRDADLARRRALPHADARRRSSCAAARAHRLPARLDARRLRAGAALVPPEAASDDDARRIGRSAAPAAAASSSSSGT